MQTAKQLYRNSSLVISGVVAEDYKHDSTFICVRVTEVFAGKKSQQSIIACDNVILDSKTTYFMFLSSVGTDKNGLDHYALTDTSAPMKITDTALYWENMALDLGSVRSVMGEFASVISVQPETYFYSDVKSLVDGTENIFIGRVCDYPKPTMAQFTNQTNGVYIENSMLASVLKVEVYGSLKGSLALGDTVELVYQPEFSESIVNAQTLETMLFETSELPTVAKDSVYVFFINGNSDEKQNLYFAVNPVQGWVLLNRDTLIPWTANEPLSDFKELKQLVKEVKSAINPDKK